MLAVQSCYFKRNTEVLKRSRSEVLKLQQAAYSWESLQADRQHRSPRPCSECSPLSFLLWSPRWRCWWDPLLLKVLLYKQKIPRYHISIVSPISLNNIKTQSTVYQKTNLTSAECSALCPSLPWGQWRNFQSICWNVFFRFFATNTINDWNI